MCMPMIGVYVGSCALASASGHRFAIVWMALQKLHGSLMVRLESPVTTQHLFVLNLIIGACL